MTDLLSHTRKVQLCVLNALSGDSIDLSQAEWAQLILDKFTNGQLENLSIHYHPTSGSLLSVEGVDLLTEVPFSYIQQI